MADSAMLNAALEWAAAGFPVFPCSPKAGRGGKRPLTRKESAPGAKDGGLYLATTDERQIRAWWTKHPDALIGLPTGTASGTAVIDLDPRKIDADAMRAALEEWAGGLDATDPETGEIVEPWQALTQSGGLHLWFAYPPAEADESGLWHAYETDNARIGNRANLFGKVEDAPAPIAEHVDVRGEGGYVIVPPSVMADGKPYRFLVGGPSLSSSPDGSSLTARMLPPIPPRLLDLLLKRGEFDPKPKSPPRDPAPRRAAARDGGRVGGTPQERARRAYADAAFANAVAAVASAPSGQRNQTLNDKALALGHLVGAGLLSESEVRAGLEDAAHRSGLWKDDGANQCRATISSGLAAGISEPADVSAIGTKAGRREYPPPPDSDPRGDGGTPRRGSTPENAQSGDGANTGTRLDAPDSGSPLTTNDDVGGPDADVIDYCASLDHSDTDNAIRLKMHFGDDLLVLAQSKARAASWGAWTGTHWDFETGPSRAMAIAQKLGGRIVLEADFVTMTPSEKKAIEAAEEFRGIPEKRLDDEQLAKRKLAEGAQKQYEKRLERKFAWAVTSKNKGRIEAMLVCHAPHCLQHPDVFNADHLRFATRNATVTFDRDGAPHGAGVKVKKGHNRPDLITQIVPVDYDPKAECPKWRAFLERMLPDEKVRTLVQVASGLGLTGLTVQKLFFHYGSGANGKSVYMETVCRVLGDSAVTLPSTSFVGEGGSGGGASPDIARLYGRRHLRVKEIPANEDLREELVKEVTGGEVIAVRDLFSGYFDFRPIFTAHMSGNGYPRITGTDNGIWRRMAVVHWPVKLAEEEQRDFDEVLAEFEPEYPGILNWLIEGVLRFLDEGLVIPEAVKAATQEYRDEMDPTSAFCAAHVEAVPGNMVQAKDLYAAYVAYVKDQGGKDARPVSMVRFGKAMQAKYERQHDGKSFFYKDISLANLPQAEPPPYPGDFPDDYAGRR